MVGRMRHLRPVLEAMPVSPAPRWKRRLGYGSPQLAGAVGAWWAKGWRTGYLATLLANLPRSVFLNRESLALVPISRRMAAYSVAAGVLPLGDSQ